VRKTIIAGNWKLYKTISEAIELANGLKRALFNINASDVDIVICPVYTALSEVAEVIANSNISLGAQDAYWQDEGAFTGEVSVKLLKDVECRYIIIGHSERRQLFSETNETVNKKLRRVVTHGLTPIMCVGETLSERDSGNTFKVLDDHIINGLKGFSAQEAQNVVIAYEPVWAIGTGKTATPVQAQQAHQYIRSLIAKLFGNTIAAGIRIQYGGSVKPENIEEIIRQPDVDGALVGGASLKVDSFARIVTAAAKAKK